MTGGLSLSVSFIVYPYSIGTNQSHYSMKETTRLNKEKFNDLKEETERWTILRNDLQDQKTTDHSATEKVSVNMPFDAHIVSHFVVFLAACSS